jgi:GT2 family glycosyltransferase
MNLPRTENRELDISIVTFNSARWLDGFFASLLRQDFPLERTHLLIRDNGSTDDTLIRCRAIEQQLSGRLASITIACGENIGFGAGHNANLATGQSAWFLVANVDLEFADDAISVVVATATQDEADIASWEFRQKPFEHPKTYDPVTLETKWSSSACILFRREALLSIGGYEKRIFMYGEDVELSYRLRAHGFRLRYCPRAVCRHHTYESDMEIKALQFFGSTLANGYLRLRYGSFWQACAVLPMYFSLWILHPKVPGIWSGLARNGLSLLRHGLYFLLGRKHSDTDFPFRGWDYLEPRAGAFFPCPDMPLHPPLVSIVVRTYAGRIGWLRESLASILNQTYPNIELVVVEDGSAQARDYLDEISRSGRLASVVYRDIPKSGRSSCGNVGLSLTRGEYVGFLDDDDLYYADHIETLVGALLHRPELGAAYALASQVRTKVLSVDPLRYREARHETIHWQRFSRPILWHHNYLPIQSVLFRRQLYLDHGGFDESLDSLEDWNLWTKYSLERDFLLVEKTTSIYRVPDNPGNYRQRQATLDGSYREAVLRQQEMRTTISPADFIRYTQDLSDNINAVTIPFLRIRNILLRNQLLTAMVFLAARIVGRIRRKRDRIKQP